MAWSCKVGLLGLLVLAGSASATTVGDIRGRPLAGQPLEVNIPFTLDDPKDRACASASVRYGSAAVPRSTLHVQGRGLKRNLLLTSRVKVNDEPVTVNVRVGCGAKAVTRRFVMAAGTAAAKAPPPPGKATAKLAVFDAPAKPARKPVALLPPGEPLFPPAPQALAQETTEARPDAAMAEELRKARADAAAATAQLETARKELAAVLDVERRTQQTLIHAAHQVEDAQSEAARMRLVLKWLGAALALGAAGLVWLEFQRVASRMRTSQARHAQEPTMLSSGEMPA